MAILTTLWAGIRRALGAQSFASVLASLVLLGACGGGGGGGGGASSTPPTPAHFLTLLSTPGALHCGWLADNESMVFRFSHSMDTTGTPLAVDLARFGGGMATWSTTTFANDTVTLTPTTLWTTGTATTQQFTATVTDASANTVTLTFGPNIYDHTGPSPYLYVKGAAEGGSDSNSGTAPGQALADLDSAYDNGPSVLGLRGEVLVAGTQTLVANTSFKGYDAGNGGVTLDTTQSYCGGFSPDFTARNPAVYPTLVVDTRTSGGITPHGAPIATFSGDSSTTGDITVEGFTIVSAGEGANTTIMSISDVLSSAGMYLTSTAAPIVSGNTFELAAAQFGAGIYVDANNSSTQALIVGNQVHPLPSFSSMVAEYGYYLYQSAPTLLANYTGFTAGLSAYGIWMDGTNLTSPQATIAFNDIDGGAGTNTYGIWTQNGSPSITDNVEINGGIASVGTCSGTCSPAATGIAISGSGTPTISGNLLISGGSSSGNSGGGINSTIGIQDGSGASIVQNVINGGTTDMTAGTVSIGLDVLGGGTQVYDQNTISGGAAVTSTGISINGIGGIQISNSLISGCGRYGGMQPTTCYGIDSTSSNANGIQILFNTINGGSGLSGGTPGSVAVKDVGGSTLLQNNLLFTSVGGSLGATGGTYCLDSTSSTSITFSNNSFFGCPDHPYVDTTGTDVDPTTVDGTNVLVNAALKAFGADPGQVDAADVDWHLTSTSPAKVRGGGYPSSGCLPGSYVNDRDGLQRWIDTSAGGGQAMGGYRSPTQDAPTGC